MTDNLKWQPFKQEQKGAMNKVWMQRGDQKALFKYLEDKVQNEQKISNELEAYRIASALKINCAKTERLTFDDIEGVLSYNTHTNFDKFVYVSAKEYAADLRESETITTPPNLSFGGLSVEYIQKNIPGAEKDLVNMMFFDCLTNNSDRHGDNWHLKISRKTGEIVGLCGMFDHDNAFRSELMLENSGCAIRHNENVNNNQKDMFKKLSADYPLQIGTLLLQARELADSGQLNDICSNRLKQMERYYTFCKNLKRTENRETNIINRFTNPELTELNLTNMKSYESTYEFQ